MSAQMDAEIEYEPEVLAVIDRLQRRAGVVLESVLPSSPRLQFDLKTPSAWFRGETAAWYGLHEHGELPLENLSWAERRWSTLAISVAISEENQRPSVVFLDEPERGLHRSAERRLPETLCALQSSGATVLVATHSPALLTDPRLATHHAQRDLRTAFTRLREVTTFGKTELDRELLADSLGISIADMYQLIRVFVCVEGEHDVAVLENLLGADLEAASARCIPLRGAKGLSHLAAVPLLFDGTDAHVLIVLDNLDTATREWNELLEANQAGNTRDEEQILRSLRQHEGGEGKWLAEFAEHAIRRGVLDRVTVVGLSQPDVICYLPAASFMNSAQSWDELIAGWRSDRRNDLKSYLRERHNARISIKSITRAAHQAIDLPLHPEIVRLGLMIRELGAFRRR